MREEYESVGDLTFYLNDQEQTGKGFARCSIKHDEIHAGTFENPRATVDGLADIYGVIFLGPKEDQRLLPQLYQHLKTDKQIQLEGDFINKHTDAFIPLRLVVTSLESICQALKPSFANLTQPIYRQSA